MNLQSGRKYWQTVFDESIIPIVHKELGSQPQGESKIALRETRDWGPHSPQQDFKREMMID